MALTTPVTIGQAGHATLHTEERTLINTLDAGGVRHDITQTLSAANQLRARSNIGLGTRSMGNDIAGAGRPDISATMDADTRAMINAATSGTTFYSTDGPQGAWVWRKRGSTWVCVEGDTGAVDVKGALNSGTFNTTTSFARLGRVGEIVFGDFMLTPIVNPAMGATVFATGVPSGFLTSGRTTAGHEPYPLVSLTVNIGSNIMLYGARAGTGTILFSYSGRATQAWPTSLTI